MRGAHHTKPLCAFHINARCIIGIAFRIPYTALMNYREYPINASLWLLLSHAKHHVAFSLQYQHNGSEALTDQFSIVARVTAGERDSLPATVRVTVLPVDDEKPKLVNNTGLKLYEGAVIVIKPDQLGELKKI
jgi:Cadherin-like